MPPIVWFFAGGAAIALLIFSVVTRFAADRIDNVTERLGDSSRLIRIIETGPHDVGDLGRRIISAVESAAGDRDDVALLGLQLPG